VNNTVVGDPTFPGEDRTPSPEGCGKKIALRRDSKMAARGRKQKASLL
jgi:hypothetical protein